VNYPEGVERSGGLIRYDLSTRKVTRYSMPDIALTMIRQNNALFIGTSNGLYVFRDGRFTAFDSNPTSTASSNQSLLPALSLDSSCVQNSAVLKKAVEGGFVS